MYPPEHVKSDILVQTCFLVQKFRKGSLLSMNMDLYHISKNDTLLASSSLKTHLLSIDFMSNRVY